VFEADGKPRNYNSAVLVHSDGRQSGRYDKMHRVPFGEFVPLRESFPWMEQFAPYDDDYGVEIGKQWTRFEAGGHRFGTIICYEDTDPGMARQYVSPSKGEPVDFLVNISNDGWFVGSSEHAQHLAICRFRAVECRRAIVRSVNMGISAVIDGNGRVVQPDQGYLARPDPKKSFAWNWPGLPCKEPEGTEVPVSRWGEFIQAKGVLFAKVPIDDRPSLYARLGDWLPLACWMTIGAGMLAGLCWPARRAETVP
jgi:apolipoprotein N-acyltransferase